MHLLPHLVFSKETIESVASGFSSATTNMNLLQEDLAKKLQGKRFLLVLDDVWNEDPEKWDRYRCALLTGGKGSRIVVTTRNENVGKLMGGPNPYHLKQLSDNDCWQLFKNHAFVDGDSSAHPRLELIGKEIVKKLKGLPLAAKAIGSLLYAKDTEDDWKNILKSEIWELPLDKNNILPALRLSYGHLPAILKRCFAFCSVFPKDYVFEKRRLVQIWMALGFIQPQGRRRMEEIGSSYFDELLSRSFFQHHKSGYVMHDAMHDLAQSVSTNRCLRLEDSPQSSNSETSARHLSFSCDNRGRTTFENFHRYERARTLLILNGYKSVTSPIPADLFLKFEVPSCSGIEQARHYNAARYYWELKNAPVFESLGHWNNIAAFINWWTLQLTNTKVTKLPFFGLPPKEHYQSRKSTMPRSKNRAHK